MTNNIISISATTLTIKPKSLDKILARNLTIPLEHVSCATLDPGIISDQRELRSPEFSAGRKIAGTFKANDENVYWNIARNENPIVIQLRDERYDCLVLGAENVRQTVDTINKHHLTGAHDALACVSRPNGIQSAPQMRCVQR